MTLKFFQGIILVMNLLVPVTILAIAAWAAIQANKREKNALAWGLIAGVAFYAPFRIVREIVKSFLEGIEQSADNLLALTLSYHLLPILVGAAMGYLAIRFLISRHVA